MRILQVCHKSPFPPSEGGPMAMKAIRDGLIHAGHSVHTFTLSTPKFTVNEAMTAQLSHFSHAYIDTSVYVWPAFRDLCLNRSHHITRFYSSKIATRLLQIVRDSSFDAVLFESVFMMPYFAMIRKNFTGPIILRAHNVEHVIWERVAANEKNVLKKQYLKILARQLKRFETNCYLQADAIAAISDVDAETILKLTPNVEIATIPFAIDSKIGSPVEKEFKARFGHIGSMDWAPNIEGLDWFLKNVWPQVRKTCPQAEFHIAGRNMPARFQTNNADGIVVLGEVENAEKFLLSLDGLIVPLFSGSGVRIKIAEAMSLGIPVITTPVGSEGLQVSNGRDIFICANADEMKAVIVSVVADPQKLKRIGAESIKTIQQYHSSAKVTAKLVSVIENKLKA